MKLYEYNIRVESNADKYSNSTATKKRKKKSMKTCPVSPASASGSRMKIETGV